MSNKTVNQIPVKFWQGTNFWVAAVLAIGGIFVGFPADDARLFGTGHRAFMFGAGVTLTLGEKRHWSHYVADAGISFLAYSAGFHLWYSSIIH